MIQQICNWLEATALSHALQNISWAVPVIQTIHILGIATVVSSMGMLGLRLLGMAGRQQTIKAVGARFLPWMWRALVVMAISGVLLIIAEPKRALPNTAFQTKMIMLVGVLAVSLFIQHSIVKTDSRWERGEPLHTSVVAKAAGLTILIAWVGIVVAGRWIAYL